jgi:hypothetical protein
MTAVADVTTILTILKGSAPTNPQAAKVVDLYRSYLTTDTPTNEQRAQAFLDGLKAELRAKLRANAETTVYAGVLAQAHLPSEQAALLQAAAATATAAGDTEAGNL